MSFMVKEFFLSSPLLAYPLIALAIFMGVFLMVSAVTMMNRAESYARVADLPLRDQARSQAARDQPAHQEQKP
jgi:hypothetical protein